MKAQPRQVDQRRFQRRWPWVCGAFALVVIVGLDRSGLLMVKQPDDLGRYEGVQVLVTRVVSPHTLEIAIADDVARRASTHVRLWGVTAPLPAGPDREAEQFSDDAMHLTKRLVENTSVILRLESHRTRDPFNRLLAHVELVDGGSLNEALLEAGLARVDERWPHSMLVRYAQAQQNARRRGEGVW